MMEEGAIACFYALALFCWKQSFNLIFAETENY